MLLRTYVDDSADQKQERAVVAGAYIGFYHQWNALQKKWRKRLKCAGISFFHATDHHSLRGEFQRFVDPVKYPIPKGREAARAILSDLEDIIHESGVMGVAVCVDMEAYRRIRETKPHAADIFSRDAFQTALQQLVKM